MFKIGNIYFDRNGNSYECVRPLHGSLPEFKSINGKRHVRSPSGFYRFDNQESNTDIIVEN